jgi:GNAT superfamily N-acetyltransferase
VTPGFVIEPLGAHDRTNFSCGSAALDAYLRERASQDVKRLVASCFVALDAATQSIAGYYTLAAASILADELPPDISRRLPRYPSLPAALVGRLAVDQRYHRAGLGAALLADAALRVIKSEVKAFAIVVEAKDENAVAFYRRHDFSSFASRPRSLFLPLETVRKARGKLDP